MSLRIHFKPKLVGEGLERGKIKITILFRSYSTGCRKFQKNRKKIQKIKKTIMASFQAKVGRKSTRKEGNKNSRSISFLPGA